MSFPEFRALVLRYVTAILETPLQFWVFVMGAWFTSNGVIAYGIFPDMAFGASMHACTIQFLGFIPVTVNGWHALFHLLTGIVGLVLAPVRFRALGYSLICGMFYLVVAALGFAGGGPVLHLMAVDTVGNIVHVVEGVLTLTPGVLALARSHRARPHPRSQWTRTTVDTVSK
jgi:hypothetical protein